MEMFQCGQTERARGLIEHTHSGGSPTRSLADGGCQANEQVRLLPSVPSNQMRREMPHRKDRRLEKWNRGCSIHT